MATSLMDRLGLGNDRAVANAHREAMRRREEERLVAHLVRGIATSEAAGAAAERRAEGAVSPRRSPSRSR